MRMRNTPILRTAALTLVACLVLPVSAYAESGETNWTRSRHIAEVTFDVAVLRPLGLVTVAVGAAAFVPVALISAPGGRDNLDTALEIFITGPAQDVFQRPLGEF